MQGFSRAAVLGIFLGLFAGLPPAANAGIITDSVSFSTTDQGLWAPGGPSTIRGETFFGTRWGRYGRAGDDPVADILYRFLGLPVPPVTFELGGFIGGVDQSIDLIVPARPFPHRKIQPLIEQIRGHKAAEEIADRSTDIWRGFCAVGYDRLRVPRLPLLQKLCQKIRPVLEVPVEAGPRDPKPTGQRQYLQLGNTFVNQNVARQVQPVFTRDLDVSDEGFLGRIVAVEGDGVGHGQLTGSAPPAAVISAM